jgi:hypothetical protein
MKPIILTGLVFLAIGLYPDYAQRIISAAETIVCRVFPSSDRSLIELIVVLVAITAIANWKPNK